MKLPYFKLKDAFNEARDSFSYGSGTEKLTTTAKLLGKSVANVGMLATEIGAGVIKRAPEIAGQISKKALEEHSHVMSDEQKIQAEEHVRKGNEAREQRLKKEREEEKKREEEKRNKV